MALCESTEDQRTEERSDNDDNDENDEELEEIIPDICEDDDDSNNNFVNTVGLLNWRALRTEWNHKPDDWKPKHRKKIDTARLHQEIVKGGSLSERVPLSIFISVMNAVWGKYNWYFSSSFLTN